MTIRRTLHATVLAASLAFGCAAIPATVASASPAAQSAIGRDSLAGYANAALGSWTTFTVTGDRLAFDDFAATRDAVAAEVARRAGVDATRMQQAWRSADSRHQVALLAALSQLGTPYRRNASSPGRAFDCSGLTKWAWAQADATLYHQSRVQIRSSKAVTRATAQAGDLVFYPGHIMMYLGVDNAIIHAPYTGRNVEIGNISKKRQNSALFGNPIG
jgi:cell wall-associated NlpC family hydrolase